jgi:predicted nucleotidyltransferase
VIEFRSLLGALVENGVEFILVGGVAATVHGSSRLTSDVDVVYRRSPENIATLAAALAPLEPSLRGAPPGLPFRLDTETIRHGLNFTLSTRAGALDLLGEITGGGGWEQLADHTIEVELFGLSCKCLDLDTLIAVKRAAGRPRDLETVAELEAVRDARKEEE